MENHIQAFLESKGIELEEFYSFYAEQIGNLNHSYRTNQNELSLIFKELRYIFCDLIREDSKEFINRFSTRGRDIVKCRQFLYKYAKENTDAPLALMARSMPDVTQDHATALHAIKNFNKFYDTEKEYRTLYVQFCERIEELKKK